MADSFVRLWSRPRFRRNLLISMVWAVIIGILYAVREVLFPFLIALALAYVIEPGVKRLNEKKIQGKTIPRWAAVLVIYFIIFAFGWILTVFFVPQLYRELSGLAKSGAAYLNEMDEERIEELSERVEEYTTRMRLPVEIVTKGDLLREQAARGPSKPEQLQPTVTPSEPAPSEPVPADPVDSGPDAVSPKEVSVTPDSAAHSQEADNTPATQQAATSPVSQISATDAVMPHLKAAPEGSNAILTIRIDEIARGLLKQGTGLLQAQTTQIVSQLQLWFGQFVRFIFSFFVVFMITAFISSNTKRVTAFFFSIVPIEDRETFDAFLGRLDYGLSGVVRGQITICLVNGFLTLIGLLILKIKFALLLATIATIFSLIPIFGSILSTIPIVLVGLTSGIWTAVLSLAWIIGIHFLEANLLNPKIMGDAAKIHPVVIVLSLVAGEHFYGLAGALFAVPIVSMMLTALRSVQTRVAALENDLANQKSPAQSDQLSSYRPYQRRIWREF